MSRWARDVDCACVGKVVFRSRADALRQIGHFVETTIYRCRVCHDWHHGRSTYSTDKEHARQRRLRLQQLRLMERAALETT